MRLRRWYLSLRCHKMIQNEPQLCRTRQSDSRQEDRTWSLVTLRHKRKVEAAVVTLSEDVSATGKALSQWQHDFTLSFISEVLNVPAARLTLIIVFCTVLFHSIFILCSIFLPMCRLFRCQNTSVLHACGDIILSQCHVFSEYKNLKNGNFIPAPQGPLKLSIISLIFAASCCLN